MQPVNQPFVHNLKPLFAAWQAVGAWSELVLISWKKAGIQIERLNGQARWVARDYDPTPCNKYLAAADLDYQRKQLNSKEEALNNCEKDVIKKVQLHIDMATNWDNWELYAPAWCQIKQAIAIKEKVMDEAVSKAAKNVPHDQAFHLYIKPLLEKVVLAVDTTQILSSVLKATRMMTHFWISAVISIAQQCKQTDLSQVTELFQIRSSAAVSEIEKMTSVAEMVIFAAKVTALNTAHMEQRVGKVLNVAFMSTTGIEEALAVMDRLRSTTIPMFISTCETITLQTLSYATDSHIQ
jgi:hypothetical protein